jgi:hypothetical protein
MVDPLPLDHRAGSVASLSGLLSVPSGPAYQDPCFSRVLTAAFTLNVMRILERENSYKRTEYHSIFNIRHIVDIGTSTV